MTVPSPSADPAGAAASKPPPHPYKVMLLAIFLPGMGQVANNMPTRGLIMVFAMLMLGWVSYHLTTPEHSFVGRHAGAFLIDAIAVMDAYRWARYRWALYRRGTPEQG